VVIDPSKDGLSSLPSRLIELCLGGAQRLGACIFLAIPAFVDLIENNRETNRHRFAKSGYHIPHDTKRRLSGLGTNRRTLSADPRGRGRRGALRAGAGCDTGSRDRADSGQASGPRCKEQPRKQHGQQCGQRLPSAVRRPRHSWISLRRTGVGDRALGMDASSEQDQRQGHAASEPNGAFTAASFKSTGPMGSIRSLAARTHASGHRRIRSPATPDARMDTSCGRHSRQIAPEPYRSIQLLHWTQPFGRAVSAGYDGTGSRGSRRGCRPSRGWRIVSRFKCAGKKGVCYADSV